MTPQNRRILPGTSYLGLACTLIPALLVFRGRLSMEDYRTCTIVGMIIGFGSALFWIKKDVLCGSCE